MSPILNVSCVLTVSYRTRYNTHVKLLFLFENQSHITYLYCQWHLNTRYTTLEATREYIARHERKVISYEEALAMVSDPT